MNPRYAMAGFMALGACATAAPPYAPPAPTAVGLSLAEASAIAHDIDLSSPLNARDLASIAILSNPDLKALRAQEGVAEAQVFAAGLLPDPGFSIGADAPLNGHGLITALSASLGLDFASLTSRPARLRAARSGAAAVRQDIAWAEWLTGEQARLLATRIGWLSDIREKSAQLRRLAEDDLKRVIAAAGRGDIPAVEVDARRLAAADASDRDRAAETQLVAARLDLNRLLGIDPDIEITLERPTIADHAPPPTSALFLKAAETRADLVSLRQGLSAANANETVARVGAFPLPSVSINAARDTSDARTLGPAISMTLPVWNRGRGDIAVARADRMRLEAEYQARLESVRADIAAASASLTLARRQLDDVSRDLAGLLAQADAADRAAQRGDIALTIAVATRLAAMDKDILADTLAQAAAESAIALDIAVGARLEDTQ